MQLTEEQFNEIQDLFPKPGAMFDGVIGGYSTVFCTFCNTVAPGAAYLRVMGVGTRCTCR